MVLVGFIAPIIVVIDMILFKLGFKLNFLDGKPIYVAISLLIPIYIILSYFLPKEVFFENATLTSEDEKMINDYNFFIIFFVVLFLISMVFW
jgi:hypothetical protein